MAILFFLLETIKGPITTNYIYILAIKGGLSVKKQQHHHLYFIATTVLMK